MRGVDKKVETSKPRIGQSLNSITDSPNKYQQVRAHPPFHLRGIWHSANGGTYSLRRIRSSWMAQEAPVIFSASLRKSKRCHQLQSIYKTNKKTCKLSDFPHILAPLNSRQPSAEWNGSSTEQSINAAKLNGFRKFGIKLNQHVWRTACISRKFAPTWNFSQRSPQF